MRHRKAGRRLGRESAHRQAMMCNLLNSLIKHERITTTLGRAKELRKLADKVITLAKKNTSASITQISRVVKNEREEVVKKLLNELGPRFKDRNGGYTRVIKVGYRRGDGAATAIVEYLGEEEKVTKKTKKKASRKSTPEKKVEAAVEIPAEPVAEEAPVEAPTEAPVDTPVDTAAEAVEETPAEAAEEAPAEAVEEKPEEKPTDDSTEKAEEPPAEESTEEREEQKEEKSEK